MQARRGSVGWARLRGVHRGAKPNAACDQPRPASRSHVPLEQEALEPSVAAYKNFNTFFYRKLKPSARPIADAGDATVIVSAADCRLTVFDSLSDATRCWIKGRRFSIAGLLADPTAAPPAASKAAAAHTREPSTGDDSLSVSSTNASTSANASGTGLVGVAASVDSDVAAASAAAAAYSGAGGGGSGVAAAARNALDTDSDVRALLAGTAALGIGGGGGSGSAAKASSQGGSAAAAGGAGTAGLAAAFEGGSMAIFRLAPQDYHRSVWGEVEGLVLAHLVCSETARTAAC